MANLAEVTSQIRFNIEQMGAKNAHHAFEHLCRHLARARICSNVIPATGPVSSGGDQGSDFETFKTHLKGDQQFRPSFTGLISNKKIAFCCTLQKKNIKTKIKADNKKIIHSDLGYEEVHYFTGIDVPVAINHELKKWAQETFNIPLDIHDGQSISELLADREVFWIAEKYLEIPGEIFPRSNNEDIWYNEIFEKWKNGSEPNINYADFQEIKNAVRHIMFLKDYKQDIPFWLKYFEFFYEQESIIPLRRKAIYEIAVVKLRGLGSLDDEADRIREYFSDIPKLNNPAELEDASNLLNYCITAKFQNLIELTPEELDFWHKKLINKVDELIQIADYPGKLCSVLKLKGILLIYFNPLDHSLPEEKQIKEAFECWFKLIEKIKYAPLFPLQSFCNVLIALIPIIGERPEYEVLTQEFDKLLSERGGGFAAAQKCKERALKYYKSGNVLAAINQVHNSQVKLFTKETLRGSVLSILILSEWYSELGLLFASKYYALAAAFLSINSDDDNIRHYVSGAIISASNYDYLQGSWCSFLNLFELGHKAYGLLTAKANESEESIFEASRFNMATMIAITKNLDDDVYKLLCNYVSESGIYPLIQDTLPYEEAYWDEKSQDDIWTDLENELLGRPFGDISLERNILWSELGIKWEVTCANDYGTIPKVEQFISILQIVLADLADVDLCLIKTEVYIDISLSESTNQSKAEATPSNVSRRWNVILPSWNYSEKQGSYQDIADDIFKDVISIATAILFDISLLPSDQFLEIIEDSFKRGISTKIFVGRSYEEIYQFFIEENDFNKIDRNLCKIPLITREFKIKENENLPWLNKPGPGYSKETTEEYLKRRYSKTILPIRYTLESLNRTPDFKETVQNLRSEGWLDWHILIAIFNATINYRVRMQNPYTIDQKILNDAFFNLKDKPENREDPKIPVSEFSEEMLKMHLKFSMISTLKVLGLECHQETPDLKGIKHFLDNRYNYSTDDIEHIDPFI